ncbi:MAG TPA: hybrid sensor histidine kinase/response regulator [Phototrophicaceae bacterium]|nr:hybrid sensor histidine kinase/response regulator [Phototrophicaceae bacterium]
MSELKDIGIIFDAKEIMALFPTVSSVQSSYSLSLLQQLMAAIENNIKSDVNDDVEDMDRGLKIRLIIPFDAALDEITQKFRQNKGIMVNYVDETKEYSIDGSALLIIDKKISIIIGINEQDNINNNNDGNKNNNLLKSESIFLFNKDDNDGSKSAVFSHITAFEIIWNQAETKKMIENADKAKEDFINICAHELRSPIQPILGLSILVKNKISDANQREMLDVIIRNAKRLKRLGDDLLEVTKIESNSIKLDKEKFNLNDFINEVLIDYSNKILKEDFNNNYTLIITKSIPRDIVFFVNVDKDRLTQVIFNILNNAVRASGDAIQDGNLENGTIQFSLTQTAAKEIQISVKDMGPGIDTQILSKLFTKFITKSGKGIGLGLFIAKSIIESHGGRIWAENNKEEKGATFYFTLPVLTQSQRNSEIKKILVVDDNPSFALSLKNTFETDDKYIVDIYGNPETMLQKFVSGYYDFVILTIEMSEINGFDLSQQLRKKDDRMQVIFMTSGGTNYEPLRELYGISEKTHFIKKTLSAEKILKQLNALVEGKTKVNQT